MGVDVEAFSGSAAGLGSRTLGVCVGAFGPTAAASAMRQLAKDFRLRSRRAERGFLNKAGRTLWRLRGAGRLGRVGAGDSPLRPLSRGAEEGARPATHLRHQSDGGVAVEWLGIEEVLVAERDCVLGQQNDLIGVERDLVETVGGQGEEATQVVGVIEGLSAAGDDRLEPLLERLLSVLCRRSRR